MAAFYGNYKCIKTLVTNGADIEAIDKDSQRPLSLALLHKHCKVVSVLIKLGASQKNIPNEQLDVLDRCTQLGNFNHNFSKCVFLHYINFKHI